MTCFAVKSDRHKTGRNPFLISLISPAIVGIIGCIVSGKVATRCLPILLALSLLPAVGCTPSQPNRNILGLLLLTQPTTEEIVTTQHRLGGTGSDTGYRVKLDSLGHLYMGGNIEGNGDLNGDGDALDGGTEDATGFGDYDAFLGKFDQSGNIIWSKRLGGVLEDVVFGIAIDSQDNVIISGLINGNVDLNGDGDNTDGGAEDSTGYGGDDIFVAKFDSAGNFLWAKRLGGAGTDLSRGVAVDAAGNVVVIGDITGNVDLNGDGDALDGGAEDVGAYGGTDVFIAKFDASGNYLWSKRLGGTGTDTGYDVVTDSLGNVNVSGYLSGDGDMNGDGDFLDGGGEDSTNYGSLDAFLVQFNSAGVYQWSKRLGGTSGDRGEGLNVDSADNVIITGRTKNNSDLNGDGDALDGGAEDSTGFGNLDLYISKFSSTGVHQWAKRLGGTDNDISYGVSVDPADNVIITGQVIGDADLNGDGDYLDAGEALDVYGSGDIFISIFSSSGTYQWSSRLGGTGNDSARGITSNGTGNIILTGYITGDGDLNGDGDFLDDGENSGGYGSKDFFISRLSW